MYNSSFYLFYLHYFNPSILFFLPTSSFQGPGGHRCTYPAVTVGRGHPRPSQGHKEKNEMKNHLLSLSLIGTIQSYQFSLTWKSEVCGRSQSTRRTPCLHEENMQTLKNPWPGLDLSCWKETEPLCHPHYFNN